MLTSDTFEAGRLVLNPGTMFRATGGPYYRSPDGTRVSMAADGPFKFIRFCQKDQRAWIEAWGSGGFCVLNVGPAYESPMLPSYVVRPYRVSPLTTTEEFLMSKTKSTKKAAKPKAEKKATKPAAKKEATKAAKKPREKKADGKLSAIDAAAQVLSSAGKPMNCKDLIAAMAEKKLWTSPGGKTPHATLYSAIIREIAVKGKEARFKKVDRGQFTFNK